jgi:DNA-binding NtrC family response regulator
MKASLSRDARTFFDLVLRAAYANPFGDDRASIDASLGETHVDDPLVVDRLLARLRKRIEKLDETRPFVLSDFAGEDRERIEAAVFFDVFHRFWGDFEGLIDAEEHATSRPNVGFSTRLLASLVDRGISAARAERLFELFYQMCRAHRFISAGLVGKSRSMRGLRADLWSAVFTNDLRLYDTHLWNRMEDFSVLLLGETGTGKGAAASALARSGFLAFDAKKRVFERSHASSIVRVNLSEVPETLVESELFGHERGSFTGATRDRSGLFSRCVRHGIVFLDEIGDVTPQVQLKLLRVLEERRFTALGADAESRFEGRIVTATHRPLSELRRDGRFRDDFYFRLACHVITLPTLRARIAEDPGELVSLVDDLVARIAGAPSPVLSSLVMTAIERDLRGYSFPGNVRELERIVRRVLVTSRASESAPVLAGAHAIDDGHPDAETLLSRYCKRLYAESGSYVEVARVTGLDRRTVKRRVDGTSVG